MRSAAVGIVVGLILLAPDAAWAQSRRVSPYAQVNPRLRDLQPGVKPPLGTTPLPGAETRRKFAAYVEDFVDPELTLDLVAGRPRLMQLKEAPFRVQVANDSLVRYTPLAPNEITFLGTGPGRTVLNLWFGDPNDPKKQTVLSYLVQVRR